MHVYNFLCHHKFTLQHLQVHVRIFFLENRENGIGCLFLPPFDHLIGLKPPRQRHFSISEIKRHFSLALIQHIKLLKLILLPIWHEKNQLNFNTESLNQQLIKKTQNLLFIFGLSVFAPNNYFEKSLIAFFSILFLNFLTIDFIDKIFNKSIENLIDAFLKCFMDFFKSSRVNENHFFFF